ILRGTAFPALRFTTSSKPFLSRRLKCTCPISINATLYTETQLLPLLREAKSWASAGGPTLLRSGLWSNSFTNPGRHLLRRELSVRALRNVILLSLILCAGLWAQTDWLNFGQDPGATRYSTLTQIDAGNVKNLKRAWTFHTGDKSGFFESTPLVVNSI